MVDRRRRKMADMREAGFTLAEIADAHGVSRQRVHQILGPTGRIRPSHDGEEYGDWVIVRTYRENGDVLCDATCRRCGRSYERRVFRYLTQSRCCAACGRASRLKLSDADIADILRRAGTVEDRRRGGAIYENAGIRALAEEYGVSLPYISKLINHWSPRSDLSRREQLSERTGTD